jgi:hypothetical protein
MGKLKPQHANIPWVVSFEFQSHADAKAFASLAEEQFGDQPIVRKKNMVWKQGAFANWRGTKAVRAALSGRSFGYEMVGEALANAGYAGTIAAAKAWIARATTEGVIVRIGRGVYEFTAPTSAANAHRDILCATCQPEPLQCLSA